MIITHPSLLNPPKCAQGGYGPWGTMGVSSGGKKGSQHLSQVGLSFNAWKKIYVYLNLY